MPKILASIILTASMLISGHSTSSPAPAPTTIWIAPATTTTLVAALQMAQWAKVAWCETHGNWKHEGAMYEGGLGILAWNWKHFGGTVFGPHAWQATPEQQVAIALKIQHGLPAPDQNGTCASW